MRLENPAGLFRFVFGTDLPPPNPQNPDDEYDPKQPVPVYMVPLSPEGAAALTGAAASAALPKHVRKFLGIKIDDDVFAQLQNAMSRTV